MLLFSSLLFLLFLLLSAFFASSETALIASNPYTLDFLEKRGSNRARHVKKLLGRVESLLATILIGNTLANVAAASVATFILSSFIPDKRQAVLLATVCTTVMLLLFGEINPKTFAAYNPVKVSLWVVLPLRLFMLLFYPFVKAFNFLTRLIFPSTREQTGNRASSLDEEEIKLLLATGIKGLSSLRRKMISGILDIGSRPIKEIMVPRPQVKAIEVDSSFAQILEIILSSEYSRYPVFRGRMDNIEGLIHAKDIIPYLVDNKYFDVRRLLRKPFFVPESASLEKVLIQMQENAVHLAFVVDEFGSMEGIVTLEDIMEEIVGEIQDEFDDKAEEEWLHPLKPNVYILKGTAPIKEIRQKLPLDFPETAEYTTLAGFLLYKFGKIPHEMDSVEHEGNRFIVEKMNKRHISLIRVIIKPEAKEPER